MSHWDLVLRLKGWQAFALMQAAIILCIAVMLRSSFPPHSATSLEMTGFATAVASVELLFFGWTLAVGAAMNSRLPSQLSRGSLFPALGLAVAVSYISFFGYWSTSDRFEDHFGGVVVALHLFSMFVNFYLLWYVSRALVAAEEKTKPPLDRVLGIFFVLWFSLFLPIGVWWVQNRARRVASLGPA